MSINFCCRLFGHKWKLRMVTAPWAELTELSHGDFDNWIDCTMAQQPVNEQPLSDQPWLDSSDGEYRQPNEEKPMENKFPNPWQPMTDPLDLKHLGKLGEECGELSAAISRCIIQGVGEREPITGKLNGEWLLEEIADVLANIELVSEHFELNQELIVERLMKKKPFLVAWHKQVRK